MQQGTAGSGQRRRAGPAAAAGRPESGSSPSPAKPAMCVGGDGRIAKAPMDLVRAIYAGARGGAVRLRVSSAWAYSPCSLCVAAAFFFDGGGGGGGGG
jgi:hypothetical protein